VASGAPAPRGAPVGPPGRGFPGASRARAYVERVRGPPGGPGPRGPRPPGAQEPAVVPIPAAAGPAEPRGTPELAVRTYVATTASVDRFGPMVAAAARRRNFAAAAARAVLGDGAAWVRGLHRRSFPPFVAVVDR